MSKEELRKSLERLRFEVSQLKEDDDLTRQKMEGFIAELEHHLADPDDAGGKASLTGNLKNHIEQFEIEHPRMTSVLNQIMMTLSGMGI